MLTVQQCKVNSLMRQGGESGGFGPWKGVLSALCQCTCFTTSGSLGQLLILFHTQQLRCLGAISSSMPLLTTCNPTLC